MIDLSKAEFDFWLPRRSRRNHLCLCQTKSFFVFSFCLEMLEMQVFTQAVNEDTAIFLDAADV